MEPIKKKRGRKPKENTIVNENPVFAKDNENIDDLIIKLNYDNTNKDIMYTINDLDHNYEHGKSTIGEVCWNCCHEFDNIVVGLPLKYNNSVFYTIGDFCSLECSARYAYENYDIYEIIPIINLYNNIVLNRIDKINMAPNRMTLKKFGGPVSIEQYRNNVNNLYNVNIPIIMHLNNNISKYEHKKNDKTNLVLFRKNKSNNTTNIFKNL